MTEPGQLCAPFKVYGIEFPPPVKYAQTLFIIPSYEEEGK